MSEKRSRDPAAPGVCAHERSRQIEGWACGEACVSYKPVVHAGNALTFAVVAVDS